MNKHTTNYFPDLTSLVSSTMCPRTGMYNKLDCLKRQYTSCKDKYCNIFNSDMPQDQEVQWKRWEKVQKHNGTRLELVKKSQTIEVMVKELMCELRLLPEHIFNHSTFFSSLVAPLNRLYFAINSRSIECVDRSDHVFNFNCLFKQFVMEWSLPRDRMGVVLMELKDWIETSKFPAHFPVEVRFVKADDIYLSPCYQQDSCYINLVMYKPFNKVVEFGDYWKKFQDILAKNNGRPHWAKDHKYTEDDLSLIYPKWQDFCDIRERLDPHGLFMNANLRRLFGKDDNNQLPVNHNNSSSSSSVIII